MRTYSHEAGHDDFWPAYTDILMVTSLILVLLVVTFVLARSDDHIKQEREARKLRFVTSFNAALAPELTSKKVSLTNPQGERQVIAFNDELLFEAGVADLKPSGLKVLERTAGLFRSHLRGKALFHSIRVNGHTDEDPIETAIFPSNWHLSSARATSVVYFLVKHGIPPQALSATGYAEFHAVDSVGRPLTTKAQKRRIEIELHYPDDWIAEQEHAH